MAGIGNTYGKIPENIMVENFACMDGGKTLQ